LQQQASGEGVVDVVADIHVDDDLVRGRGAGGIGGQGGAQQEGEQRGTAQQERQEDMAGLEGVGARRF
jgi:hypothetical protein